METAEIIHKLHDLARNLYWAWHPEVIRVFRDLDPELWRETNHSPTEFLSRLADKAVEERAAELSLDARVSQAYHHLRRYLQGEAAWGSLYAGRLRYRPVAYFCSEFGLHEALPVYSGGLGVLAGDHLKAASDLAVPTVGVGLLYTKGYFQQTVDTTGWQREQYPDLPTMPLEPVRDDQGKRLRASVQTEGDNIWIEAWSVPVGRNRLILLDTNVSGNSDADRALTANLYAADMRVRIRQELVLGVGGMRVLEALDIRPSVLHLNEGHSAFAVLDLIRQLMDRDGQTFANMREVAATMVVFTTHTPVAAGHDRFEPPLIRQALSPLRQQLGISERELMALGRVTPSDDREPFCMTVLGLKMSRHRNAVSGLHAHVTRAMWHKLWPTVPEEQVPIQYITNGVHVSTWLAEPMARLFSHHLGPDWYERMDDPRTWEAIDSIQDADLWQTHQTLRSHLIDYLRRCLSRQAQARGEPEDQCVRALGFLNPQALTVVWARRIAEYKRPTLLFQDMEWLDRMVNGPRPVQFVFAGKAHPSDDAAKLELQKVFQSARDSRLVGKVVFLEDYNINVARHLVQGADLWLSTPRRPLEACGTSGQKAALNGGVIFSTLDGWWAEAYDGTNGFAVGFGTEHSDWKHQDKVDGESLRWVLEHTILPCFYDRDPDGIPRGWIAIQKRCLRTLVWRYSAHRMLVDYSFGCYLPAAGSLTSSLPLDTRAHAMFMR